MITRAMIRDSSPRVAGVNPECATFSSREPRKVERRVCRFPRVPANLALTTPVRLCLYRPLPKGATLTSKEKLDIARNLAKLGVDIIEAGFPIASPDDLEAVRNIAKNVGNEPFPDGYVPVICGLSRANKKDIDASWEGVRHAMRPRIHTFIATSKIHMEDKLKKTPDEVVQIAVDAVTYARSLGCVDVEFSPEDAGRSEPAFLHRILTAVVEAGATTLNIPDTVGICLPEEFGRGGGERGGERFWFAGRRTRRRDALAENDRNT